MTDVQGNKVIIGFKPDVAQERFIINFVTTAYGNNDLLMELTRLEKMGLREFPKKATPFSDVTAQLSLSGGERSLKGNYIFDSNGEEVKINYSVREQLNNISEATTLDNLKRFLNPLDYSRFRETVIDNKPGLTEFVAEHLGTPFWKKENNPAAAPFYDEAKEREVARMDNNIRMFGGLVDKEGKRVGWDKVKGLFDWEDKTTAWGKIRQEQYDKLMKDAEGRDPLLG